MLSTRARRSLAALLVLLATTACAGSSSGSSSTASRPSTPATLEITSPTPSSVTGPDVGLRMQLRHARIIPPTQAGGSLRGDRGHIHVSVDGQLITMAYGLDQPIPALTPGRHTIQAEFVAADHLPFSNRVVAAVGFVVR